MSHDPLYVMTAIIYSAIGSTMTMMLFGRAIEAPPASKRMWALLAGIIGGSAIWTTHFIALLGLQSGDEQFYFLFLTLGALLIGTILCSIGFLVAASSNGRFAELGGAVVGSGIIASHVISVFALNVVGIKNIDHTRLLVGVAIGVVLGALSVGMRVRHADRTRRWLSAAVLMAAVLGVHYVGISGLTIIPGEPSWMTDIGITDRYLFSMVIFFGTSTLLIGGVVFMIEHHNAMERMRALENRAFNDLLTKLPNRAKLEETLASTLGTEPGQTAVVSFDLNRFKNVNDVHGHQAGDHVLRIVAERLRSAAHPGEFISRSGGDEFVAVKHRLAGRDEAAEFANRLGDAVVGDIDWEGNVLSVGTSLGVALYPLDGGSPEDVAVKANLAMNRAKRSPDHAAVFYDAAVDEANRARSALSIEMRQAIENNEFELFFQRQTRIEDSKLMGYEVLLRWNHPERGYVSPDVFIPIAERDGYIVEIGEWVLRRACMEAVAWTVPMKIAVNVAARQIEDGQLPGIVSSALEQSGLDASRLEIEITESGIIKNRDQALEIVRALKALGVSIAMDDFGTGYSSLSTLQDFPFDKIKIDKAFIRGLGDNPQSESIVRSTVSLGRDLNIDVLAEGVETREHLEFLREVGCTQVQGFLFGKPIAAQHMPTRESSTILPFTR